MSQRIVAIKKARLKSIELKTVKVESIEVKGIQLFWDNGRAQEVLLKSPDASGTIDALKRLILILEGEKEDKRI